MTGEDCITTAKSPFLLCHLGFSKSWCKESWETEKVVFNFCEGKRLADPTELRFTCSACRTVALWRRWFMPSSPIHLHLIQKTTVSFNIIKRVLCMSEVTKTLTYPDLEIHSRLPHVSGCDATVSTCPSHFMLFFCFMGKWSLAVNFLPFPAISAERLPLPEPNF